ncbi:MAG: general secretion pathway protein GspK, partial [Gammaproteobacteria bacterium]
MSSQLRQARAMTMPMTMRVTMQSLGARRERGFALLLVLWLGVMVSVMAASFAFSARTETRIGRSALDRAQAEFLADAAVKRAALGLLVPVRDQRFKADGRDYTWQFGGADLRIQLAPENARLDLNRAPEELIEGLFDVFVDDGIIDEAEADALTDALLDWRDNDRNKRSSGAENAAYSSAGRPHGAADRPLLTVSEIGQILGMNAVLIERLTPLVTVHAKSARIDGMTAPRDVLRALPGVTVEQVDEFLQKRGVVRAELIEKDRAAADE